MSRDQEVFQYRRQADEQRQRQAAAAQATQQTTAQQANATWTDFHQDSEYLIAHQRNSLFSTYRDSAEMAAVKQDLRALNDFFQQQIPLQQNQSSAQAAQCAQLYDQLLDSCRRYITAKGRPLTSQGRARLRMVQQLQNQLARERQLLAGCIHNLVSQAPQQGAAIPWSFLLHELRQAQLDTEGLAVRQVGNGTSEVLRIADGANALYFKPEEKAPPATLSAESVCRQYIEEHRNDPAFQKIQPVLSEYIFNAFLPMIGDLLGSAGISLDDLEPSQLAVFTQKMQDPAAQQSFAPLLTACPLLQNMEHLATAFRMATTIRKPLALDTACKHARIAHGRPLSQRNVAACRIASLLGMPSLVAESKTVLLTHEGQTTRGNLMRHASGMSMYALHAASQQPGALPLRYSPEVMRQLSSLQLMDSLCGQIDRNASNYMLEYEDRDGFRVLTKVTAIDNDISFGTLSFDRAKSGISALPELIDKPTGKITLPALDEDLCNRIMALTPAVLRFALADLLENDELDALAQRLQGIQQLLRDQQAAGNLHLLRPDEWAQAVPLYHNASADRQRAYISTNFLPPTQAPAAAAPDAE